jgi:hypothetical protein
MERSAVRMLETAQFGHFFQSLQLIFAAGAVACRPLGQQVENSVLRMVCGEVHETILDE